MRPNIHRVAAKRERWIREKFLNTVTMYLHLNEEKCVLRWFCRSERTSLNSHSSSTHQRAVLL
ncbi:hypothetical protein M404DRAFT_999171 [Pisolithus tinctorius Marx 270]|uniref:Uncharacterized protein n=1 Tax=Pisolithus tinctorius Marx 270 TaxID=870435 RepID=A0A0C3PEB3_PISTI|nr:hypothetical protein M404DRAFT_999171 [Pisolithus tinctorius Marx 270]